MNIFDKHLQNIHGEISLKENDRQPYTEIFDTARNWLLQSMCKINPVFKKLYTGTCLFGSYVNRVRIIKPSEFDVFIVLKFPFGMKTVLDNDRPGFVHLDLNGTFKRLSADNNLEYGYDEIYGLTNDNDMLKRNSFQWWINNIIEEVFETCSVPHGYSIEYEKHAVAHNLYVSQLCSNKKVSIDLVPGFRLDREKWMRIRRYPPFYAVRSSTFLAIPKSFNGSGRHNNNLTFQVVNPQAERKLLWNRQNLKVVYRLLKSLRNRFKLKRIKSYFLTAVFLWVLSNQKSSFWRQSLSRIFLYMLARLTYHFETRRLPYFWASNYNLLSILKPIEITEYANTLKSVLKILKTYPRQYSLSLNRAKDFFELPCDLVSNKK